VLSRPSHALISGVERAARARALKGEIAGYLEGRRELDALGRRNAVAAQLERNRQAAEAAAAAAAAAAAPPKPVAAMSPAEFKAAQRQFVRALRLGA
jgi:hypothetical protein